MALTKALIEAAAARADQTSESQELKDHKVTGMFVRVTGRAKWPVAYVRFSLGIGRSAKRVERKVGEITLEFPLEAARDRALELGTAGRLGKDLVAETIAAQERRKQDEQDAIERMFPVVARKWTAWLEDQGKRWKDAPRIVESDMIPAWEGKRIEEVSKADVRDLVKTVTRRAKNSGRRGATGQPSILSVELSVNRDLLMSASGTSRTNRCYLDRSTLRGNRTYRGVIWSSEIYPDQVSGRWSPRTTVNTILTTALL